MSHYTRTNRASSYFFFLGFIFSKLQRLPVVFFATFFNAFSLSLYLIGYLLWFTATLINPDKTHSISEWYGFAEFKEQSRYSAIIGVIATITSLVAIFYPILLLPAAWAFLISNIIWTISEYHQLNNPPQMDPTFSYSYQETYLSYAMTITFSSLLAALSITIGLLFPPIALPVLIITLICSVGLGALALEFWLSCTFDHHKTSMITPSYNQIGQKLVPNDILKPDEPVAPYQGSTIFDPQKKISSQLSDEFSELACKSSTI